MTEEKTDEMSAETAAAKKPAKKKSSSGSATKAKAPRVTWKLVDEKYNGIIEAMNRFGEQQDRILAELSAGTGGSRGNPETDRRVQDIYFMSADLVERVRSLESRPIGPAGGGSNSAGEPYVTSREQYEAYSKLLNRREGELADSKFMSLLLEMCNMREDMKELLANMERNKDNLTIEDALNSFETYQIDLENMLTDAGVKIGPYGKEGDRVDTVHQRIADTVPTDDPSLNGKVAKRLSEGYEYSGRAIVKEKVTVYKTAQQ